jgi:hypothetical protein
MTVRVEQTEDDKYFNFTIANTQTNNHVRYFWDSEGRLNAKGKTDLDLIEEVSEISGLEIGKSYFTRENLLVTIVESNLLNTMYKGRYFCPEYKEFFEDWWLVCGTKERKCTDELDLIEEVK